MGIMLEKTFMEARRECILASPHISIPLKNSQNIPPNPSLVPIIVTSSYRFYEYQLKKYYNNRKLGTRISVMKRHVEVTMRKIVLDRNMFPCYAPLVGGKGGVEPMGTNREVEAIMRFRLHPATVPPMQPYWWKTESQGLRGEALRRRKEMPSALCALWSCLRENKLGTQCLRGVVVSGRVVDFFFPEARLILDRARAPQFLGLQLMWFPLDMSSVECDVEGVVREIAQQVTERAGIVAHDAAKRCIIPALPLPGSERWSAMVSSALSQRR
jgi:hypothetical protein